MVVTDQGGATGTGEPGEASGMTGHGGDKGARSQDGVDGSQAQVGVRDPVVGGGDKGSSHLSGE